MMAKDNKAKFVNKVKRKNGETYKSQGLKAMNSSIDRDQNKEGNMTTGTCTGKPNYREGNKTSYPQKHGTAPSLKQEGKSKEG